MSENEESNPAPETFSPDMRDPDQVGHAMQLLNDNIVRLHEGLRDLTMVLGLAFASSDSSQGRASVTALLHAMVSGDEQNRPVFQMLRCAIENAPKSTPPDGGTFLSIVRTSECPAKAA